MPRRDKKQSRRFKDFAWVRFPYCQWCGIYVTRENATTDHVIPLTRGGSNGIWNLCLACKDCNHDHGGSWPVAEPPYGPRWRWSMAREKFPPPERASGGRDVRGDKEPLGPQSLRMAIANCHRLCSIAHVTYA
jgi:hypothetical protein